MALIASLRFVTANEDATGDGWEVALGEENATPTVTQHATITAAQAAILAAFQADAEVDGYFQQAAEDSVLAANSGTVATTKAGLLTAEGL